MADFDRRMLLGAAGIAGVAAISRKTPASPALTPMPAPKGPGCPDSGDDPRTPVTQQTCPGDAQNVFIISRPGSYYLTAGIGASGGRTAIQIAADFVTHDLSGFLLDGTGNGTSFGSGIWFSGTRRSARIFGGIVRGFRAYGITGQVSGAAFEDLELCDNQLGNLEPFVASDSVARNVRVRGSTGEVGIGLGDGSSVTDCTVEGPNTGIAVGSNSLVAGCAVTNCLGVGIAIGSGLVTDCVVSGATDTSHFNNGGIVIGNAVLVQRCVLRGCVSCGVLLGDACTIVDCEFVDCARGVLASQFMGSRGRIERSSFYRSQTAIRLESPHHFVTGNRFSGNTTNFDVVPGSAIGEVIDFTAGGVVGAAAHGAANLVW